MTARPQSSPLLLASVLAMTLAGLALLFYGLSSDRSPMHILPTENVRLEILPDPQARLTLAEVVAQPAGAWQRWTSHYYIQAFDGGAVWVRATLTNPSSEPIMGVLADDELILDHLDCWTADPAKPGGWLRQSAGESVPAVLKPIWGREAAVYLTVPARGETVAYLRASDHFGTWLRAVWWPRAQAFHAAQLRNLLVESLYFGILLALLVYNGVLWARLRHADLGYYLGYLSSVGLFMAVNRNLHQVIGLSLGSPGFEPLVNVTLAASAFFHVQFARNFLGLGTASPRLDGAARILGWLALALGFGAPCLLWSQTTAWMHVVLPGIAIIHFSLLLIAVLAWRAGAGHARFFLLSYGLFFAGTLPFAAYWMLAIPVADTTLAVMLGSALEMLLLSLAMADRFARLERARHTAQLAEEKARLEALRYQLNPHFLFNALNSIYGLVYPHSPAAGDIVRRLADFCRDTLTRPGGQWQPLGDEVTMLRNYLGIEQARWRDRLVVEISADPAADNFLLPPFLLLPLLDNAIKHGGATSPDVLTVRLGTTREAGGTIVLTIANTGEWIQSDGPRPATSTGVGLENIRARLQHAFPNRHSFTTSAADGWVTLTLRFFPQPGP